jgi:hypothetical protein
MADDRYTLTDVEALAAHLRPTIDRQLGDLTNLLSPTQIADAALTWVADHGWSQGARKHRSTDTPSVAVCPKTIRGKHPISYDAISRTKTFYDWPCVRAAGHDGDCQPDSEWETEKVPYTLLSAQELYDRLILTAGALRSERCDRSEAFDREREERLPVARLLNTAVEEGSGRTAKHGPGCWLKHVACLANEVLNRPHDAEQRLAEHRGGAS